MEREMTLREFVEELKAMSERERNGDRGKRLASKFIMVSIKPQAIAKLKCYEDYQLVSKFMRESLARVCGDLKDLKKPKEEAEDMRKELKHQQV